MHFESVDEHAETAVLKRQPEPLSYGADSIHRRAKFSGDFDSMHFDPERAQQRGEDDVIVHDMLPQVCLQQCFGAAATRRGHGAGKLARSGSSHPPPLVVRGTSGGTSGLFRFDVIFAGRPILQAEIGLHIAARDAMPAIN